MTHLPKILHLYWGQNQPLSYFRYLTVISFAKHNPGWKIKVWVSTEVSTIDTPWTTGEQSGEYIGHDYLENLDFYRDNIDMSSIGIPSNIPEVHKSDLLRWYLLGTYGGVWSDFDILYIAPLSDEITNTWNGPGLCYYELPFGQIINHKFQAIGFLASAGQSGKDFFLSLFQRGLNKIPQIEYQALGAKLIENEHLPAWESSGNSVFYLDKNLVYPYTDGHLYFTPNELHIENSIGLHWYAGHPVIGSKAATITELNIKEKVNEYSICKEALKVI